MVQAGDHVSHEVVARAEPDRTRSVAQLNMLHSLATKLNSLGDVASIGNAITAELRTIIDYHSCRVYLLQADGSTLLPASFRGEIFSDYENDTVESLTTEIGEGITGWVAEHRTSLLTPDAREVEFAVQIPGTDDVLESMLAVPMLAGDQLIGVIVLSMLGYAKFDLEDQRLLEVLASHAAVAFDNANLLDLEREAAATSASLLNLSQALTRRRTVDGILQEAVEAVPRLIGCSCVAAYLRDEETGDFRIVRILQLDGDSVARTPEGIPDVPADLAKAFLDEREDPFVVPAQAVHQVPRQLWFFEEARDVLVAPLRWTPAGVGVLAMVAPSQRPFREGELRLAGGIADVTSLALGNARRLSELERFHELVESLDAVFWEADPDSLRLSFLSSGAEHLLGTGPTDGTRHRTWGEHVVAEDRGEALERIRQAVDSGEDRQLEYRVATPAGTIVWIRDLVHVVGRAQQIRGLMVDITGRKRAEEALRRSERKFSEAFRREREAAQRLRTLDDMKNTFLEAVSHDLRTPLTSILGSALTLEQAGSDLSRPDATDLVRRIAANARKLERLLGDLLDLDRLQRGIVTPQRRPIELLALVERSIEGAENPDGRPIDVEVEDATVSVDAAKVERIIENLVSNALRHTASDARIWVRASGRDGGLDLVVEDEGAGIPPDLHEAIFEPFRQAPGSTTAAHSPGVGIGLSLVRRFAELHGGRAWVDDRPGGGASFHVFLPGG
ncbi:MAG TPA: ATP-binding protein [Actinomycetota bacterium]|jgi:PAS domain S-box-containing protein